MPQGLVYALHGFLGQASDWNQVRILLEQKKIQFIAEDLFSHASPAVQNFSDYVDLLKQRILQKTSANEKKIFLGYSLGGRLGLHLLEKFPQLFDHYVFLSTNPGTAANSPSELAERIKNDQAWAEQITEANWDLFFKKWNAQQIFDGSMQEPVRSFQQYDLHKLQAALTEWSLAKQKDFSSVIEQNQNKITWVVGDKDPKYCQLAEDLKQKKILLDYKRILSSHRIWLDRPEAVSSLLQDFF